MASVLLLSKIFLTLCLSVVSRAIFMFDNEAVKWSMCLTSQPFLRIIQIAPRSCFDECLARKRCLTFCYHRRVCILYDTDENSAELERKVGSIFGQKLEWKRKTLAPDCLQCSNNAVCSIGSDWPEGRPNYTCAVKECGRPSLPPDVKINGNMLSVGKEVKKECKNGVTVFGSVRSVCTDGGTFENTSNPTCVPDSCLPLPEVENAATMLSANGNRIKATFTCSVGMELRGTPVYCSQDTDWGDTSTFCCDLPETDGEGFTRIYRLAADGGWDPYRSWVDQKHSETGRKCQVRNGTILTSWARNAIVHEVKVEVLVGTAVKAWLRFSATGSTSENWFRADKLVASSWSDLGPFTHSNIFSIAGDTYQKRRWFINKIYTLICHGDTGWLVVVEAYGCDRFKAVPGLKIYFSGSQQATEWRGDQVLLADSLLVSGKLVLTP